MPDGPDYFQYRRYSNRHVLGDMAELAVRLGSPIAGGRLGDVVWFSQMDQGIAPFDYTLDGTGADLNIVSHQAEYGGYCLTLTAGSDGLGRVVVEHNSNRYEDSKHGLEVHAAFITEFDTFDFAFELYDGSTNHVAEFRLSATDGEYQYRTGSTTWVSVGTMPDLVSSKVVWHTLKLLVDPLENEFVRFSHGETVINLQGISLWDVSNSNEAKLRVRTNFNGRSGNNDMCLLDLIILTVNEPL